MSGKRKCAASSKDDDMQRQEGMAIVLLGPAIDAWKRTGQRWKAWGPRAVSQHPCR